MCEKQICRFDIIETPSETQVNIAKLKGLYVLMTLYLD